MCHFIATISCFRWGYFFALEWILSKIIGNIHDVLLESSYPWYNKRYSFEDLLYDVYVMGIYSYGFVILENIETRLYPITLPALAKNEKTGLQFGSKSFVWISKRQ